MVSDRPNIVLLLLDAARARNFSCYGYDRATTPFIDQLAAGGTRYEFAFANSIYSLPSYASLFTGQYPTEHGALDWNDRISENVLVEGLNDAGYETTAVSTHLVSDQFGIGDAFDTTESLFLESKDVIYEDDPVSQRMRERIEQDGWDSSHEKYLIYLNEFLRRPSYKSVVNGGYKLYRRFRNERGWWDDDGGDAAVESAKQAVSDATEPFFLFLNFIETHDPYRPPREFLWEFLPNDATLGEVKDALEYVSTRATAGEDEITPRQRELLLGLYDAEIRYVDEKIREFVAHLESEGLRDDTLIVLLSDHGDAFGEHGLWGHQGRVYNELCHVPLVVDYPWNDGGEVVTETTELRHLCDTLTAVGNGEKRELATPGEALVEYYGWDTQLSFEPWEKYESVDFDDWGRYQVGFIDDRIKLIWDAAGTKELYDIGADYGEANDLGERRADVVSGLRDRVVELVGTPEENDARYRADVKSGINRDAELTEHLQDLGYME